MSDLKPELWAVELGQGMGVIRLGATREEVVRSLADVGIKLDDDGDDDWLYVDEMDSELYFKTTTPQILLEIMVEDERVRLGPLTVMDERLHKVVDLLQVPDSETVWRTRDDDDDDRPTDGNRPIMTDEGLLDRGTLWIPALGLGLGMVRGEITIVRLRKPEESPRRGYGSLTPAQRELSARNDLLTYLIRPKIDVATMGSRLQTLLALAVAVAIGLLIWQGIVYQGRWNAAPVVEGEVIDVKPPPPDPFPDEYTITYRDQTGNPHQVVLKRNDVYVTAHIGEKVEIRFLPETPDKPLGPARYRDAAFEKFIPLGIGVVAVYCVLQVVIPIVGWVLQRSRRHG